MPKGTKTRARGEFPKAVRKRIQVGLIISAEVKALLETEAANSGLTQSQVAERLIEKALDYDRMFAVLKQSLTDIERQSIHAAMARQGYHPLHTAYGTAYLPPDTPLERSGFRPFEAGEPVPPAVELPPLEPLPPDRTAEATAELEARIAALEALVPKPEQDR